MQIQITGLFGLIILIADIYALINVVQSRRTSTGAKVVWILAILFLPVAGFVAWLLFGPRDK
ncbi:MAG: PLDc N-terminal domain-containing protein [Thalassolituus sp.]|jgi:hypothetical protein|uniref:Cardiolipin synthase N-terminal domain-containing protein n=2 Tax=root TaxID=1 RepID=M5DL35_9GAMM|nr:MULTISPECIES: PLDc N-terminal domain-containing protein [Thalassolituus]MBQ0725957.1 PLDc N-terminal domain-containing protein [Thalassolituus oleivorans]MBQ0782225.1 PLDc N-terminal domain-containing protein [Thalassolituus oleivorans]MCA6126982.1 hypothetical protein [Thalassolituus oleivorans 4BN06-13]MDF1642336.1 PLDc N-terminal domain-containing protein [Thalassolituus oleivorans]CCU70465.1 hypothetical protein TOL_0016 [Thalassolituus oleivorans MIL-1]|tara:strand:+ start:540 stop:725 length:186 start_codon:yes stop_codon:yes gene_type:complete